MTLRTFDHIEQGTPAWHDLRRGIVTASTVGKLITNRRLVALEVDCPVCGSAAGHSCMTTAKGKSGPIRNVHPERAQVAREDERTVLAVGDVAGVTYTLAAERLTGRTEETFVNNDMLRGTLAEPVARDVYSTNREVAVAQTGFMLREEDGWSCGWSPDGLIGRRAGIEIKAPRAKAHLKTIVEDEVPEQHIAQCQAALLVSGRDELDFISFHGGLALYVKRVFPDPAWFAVIEQTCRAVEKAVQHVITVYTERAADMPATEPFDFFEEITA